MEHTITQDDVVKLIEQLETYRKAMRNAEYRSRSLLKLVKPHYKDSARNLIHYLALRSFELRTVQDQLSSLGLSSLSHSERYTYVNVTNILFLLYLLTGKSKEDLNAEGIDLAMTLPKSKLQLEKNTIRIFGDAPSDGHTRIMVTLPTEAGNDSSLLEEWVIQGVNIVRINCSQDNKEIWLRMIANVRSLEERFSKKIHIYMDLAGPKIRTSPLRDDKKLGKKSFILLQEGDYIEVHRELKEGLPGEVSKKGKQKAVPKIGVSHPELFDFVREKDRIWFDDGVIGGIIERIENDVWHVRVVMAPPGGAKLRGKKGINLPDSELHLPALSDEDLAILPFVTTHADMVGYSFVQKGQDVELLQQELDKYSRPDLGIILKIETNSAFKNLPELLLTAMRSNNIGVMIARGDLAVEVGWSRIAEVQEEIGWICEAAHIPNIWATQILENLAKEGLATRAEITDAVAAVRAECAMLNKGPYILKAIKTLQKISARMDTHQFKKKPEMRLLKVAEQFISSLQQA